jgi:hypothetical protein
MLVLMLIMNIRACDDGRALEDLQDSFLVKLLFSLLY